MFCIRKTLIQTDIFDEMIDQNCIGHNSAIETFILIKVY